MNERRDARDSRPLPREWLPDALPAEAAPEWDASTRRIMAAAGPRLQGAGRLAAKGTTWWSALGLWWRPAAALAVAAAAVLLLTRRPVARAEPPAGAIALGLVASDGDPATLWGAVGTPADPVLALITLQEAGDASQVDAAPIHPREEIR